ncbi:MAG: YbjQ family protein [Pirellulales bacterium]
MIVTNTETVAGYQVVEIKGLVQGNTVRAKHAGRDIAASFKNLVGGELKSYESMLDRARREATLRILEQAREAGYNALCNLRLETADVGGNTSPTNNRGGKAAMATILASATAYHAQLPAG